ncbi:MAG: NAD(+) synthase [Lachnospiraceae bacterium]|nr:NAD(+) synthase [Lachnospiraceae bacterium]
MKDGYIRVCAVTPALRVADTQFNSKQIETEALKAYEKGAGIIVFPELSVTGYSCGDLFLQDTLLEGAIAEVKRLARALSSIDGIVFVGLPLVVCHKLYNVAAALSHGNILGFVPKSNIPTYNEFYEGRYFAAAPRGMEEVRIEGIDDPVPFGTDICFTCDAVKDLSIAAEICEDLWVPVPPSNRMATKGATVIVNLSASNELVGKGAYRRELVAQQSARLYGAYIYACAGADESTQDVVYSGHSIIAENGRILSEKKLFENGSVYADIDIEAIGLRRRAMSTYGTKDGEAVRVSFPMKKRDICLERKYDPKPFVPTDPATLKERCEEILDIQSYGLKKRLVHTGCKKAVLGISGGLDSTYALLVTVRAFNLAGLGVSGIISVTMPGFGTTDRTHNNAVRMCESLGVTLREISIAPAVTQHFKDIGQDPDKRDVTYENAQARERTQILMDIANMEGGLVIGTGDLSELALGWATYNGDHMSMYGVNASIPKTLIRHLVRYYADNRCEGDSGLKGVLYDILDTPVSPELLPPEDGKIFQRTEDIVGPYELHDFYLYYMMRWGFSPEKIYRIACMAFEGVYDPEEILKWEKVFYKRFFSQQFKRSCLPDGPKVGTVALSPRGDLRMPSDASAALWLSAVEKL